MKFNPYPFISKANQVLFFFGAVIVMTMIGVELIKDIWPRQQPSQRVKVVEKKDAPEGGLVVEYRKVYERKIKDVHVIELRSDTINALSKHVDAIEYKADMFSSNYKYKSYDNDADVINILFVDERNNRRVLFESDRLIVSKLYASFGESRTFNRSSKNVYSVVTEDTNNNGFLDEGDSMDVYVSEYNGQDNQLVMEDVLSYRLIDNDQILIRKNDENDRQFFTYDINAGNLVKIDTGITLQ